MGKEIKEIIKEKEEKFEEHTYYRLTNITTKEVTIAFCYRNPDASSMLGFGFNTADGGGWLPIYDLTSNTIVEELEFTVKKRITL